MGEGEWEEGGNGGASFTGTRKLLGFLSVSQDVSVPISETTVLYRLTCQTSTLPCANRLQSISAGGKSLVYQLDYVLY